MLVLLLSPTANDFSAKPTILNTNTLREREREREDLVVVQELSDGIFSAKYSRSIQSQNRCREVRERERGKKSSGED
jgi:hypothetical protein